MCALLVVRPYLVAGVKEFVCQQAYTHTVELFVVIDSDIVKTDVDRLTLEAAAFLLVVGLAVEVVVNGVVVYHLRDREIMEEVGRTDATQVFREDLHQQGLADAYTSLNKKGLVHLVVSVGENIFAERTAVEVIKQKAQYLAVVIVNDELAALRLEDNFICDPQQELLMCAEGVVMLTLHTYLPGLLHCGRGLRDNGIEP